MRDEIIKKKVKDVRWNFYFYFLFLRIKKKERERKKTVLDYKMNF